MDFHHCWFFSAETDFVFLVFLSFLLLPGSKRDRGVEDSCAKHLTTEFYAVIMLLTFILIIISIPSPPHSFIPGLSENFPFLQILPTVPFLYFFRTDSMHGFPRLLTTTSEYMHFLHFLFFHFLVVGSVR